MQPERVVVAELLRPRGNRGELLARSQTDVPGRLQTLKRARVRLADGQDIPVEIVEAWSHRREWVLKLAGVDSIGDAERFRGAELWVPREERGTLPAGEYFQTDLIGCSVIDRTTNKCLGVVEGCQQYGGPALMQLTVDGREVLIPFVSAVCEVDLGSRRIVVDVPEGLLEL